MSVVIIIGGSGRAKAAVDSANQDASSKPWTRAQKDTMAQKFNDFADDIEQMRASFNKS